ncbi:hypothetical protein CFPU101_21880 [Chroococcus sp. FPU101]|nr:hypothetical protein CFPU101_21880 [Chroococcus sp. FPU101]
MILKKYQVIEQNVKNALKILSFLRNYFLHYFINSLLINAVLKNGEHNYS